MNARRVALAAVVAFVAWAGLPRPPAAPPAHPPPADDALAAGKARSAARKAWFKERHKAPPELDWQQIERDNGLAQISKRNRILADHVPIEPRWVERGSVNQAGRMFVGRPSPDGSALYAGSALGGLWVGTPEGTDWQPLGDNLYGGVHWLLALPPEADGGPDALLVATDGGLVHRTTDLGATWTVPDGIPTASQTRRLARAGDGTLYLLLALGWYDDYRLFASTDDGRSFTAVRELGSYAGDLWAPRDASARVWLLDADAVWTSEDRGATWTETATVAAGSSGGELVGSEAGAPTLYAMLQVGDRRELWRSDDALTFASVRAVADYWGQLDASTLDPLLIAWGGVNIYRSADGGTVAPAINSWEEYYGQEAHKLHADAMGIEAVPDGAGGETWYLATDGGLYRSRDGLLSVENLSLHGLRVSQYYSTLTSTADPDNIAAGAQDQGYQVTNGLDQSGEVYEFSQILSGDYGHLTSTGGNHELVYSVYPTFVLVQYGEGTPGLTWTEFPPGETYAWLPPIVADPDEPWDFYFPARHLYRMKGRDWVWTPEQWSEQDFQANEGEYLSALAFSPLDHDRAWAATNWGRLFWSTDRGVTWTKSDDTAPFAQYFYGTALVPSAEDVDTVYVGGSGYGAPDVLRSTDGGRTWEEWDQGLPATLVYCMAEAPDGSGRIFAGTETAAYMRDPAAGEWQDITSNEAPVTIYWSVEALHAENAMRFGTYGRGIWDYQLDPEHQGCFPVQDFDDDGADCEADCDDHDAARVPGTADPCGDGIDQDCDGADETCPEPEDTAPDPDDAPPPADEEEAEELTAPGGCGCGGGSVAPVGLLAALLVRRRR